jgi:hypothetical protein
MTNEVSCLVNNKQRELISAEIERNGTRAVDVGRFVFPRNVAITKGDLVTYLQDPVNIKHLVGIWNFNDNTRDESGFDHDGLEDADETTAGYDEHCDGRVIEFSADDDEKIKITNSSRMAFDGQFDIIIWFCSSTSSTGHGGLFSKGDSSNKIQIETLAKSGSTQYVQATIIQDSNTPVVMTGTNANVYGSATTDSSGFHFARLKRDENDLVTFSVDGTTEGTPTTIRGDIATGSTFLYLGADINGANVGRGKIAQVRLYSGGYLRDEDYTTLRQARRQPNTMKFGGKVWKIDEKPTHSVAHCKGLAKALHDIEVLPNTKDDNIVTWNATDTDIFKNKYTDKHGEDILKDLLPAHKSDIKVVDVASRIDSTTYDEYNAAGTLYENVILLTLNTNQSASSLSSSFSIDSRNVLRLEDDNIDYHTGSALGNTDTENNHNKFSAITFKQGVVKVESLGYDDSTSTSVVTSMTNVMVKHSKQTATQSDFDTSDTINQLPSASIPMHPAAVRVTHSSAGELTNTTFSSEPSSNTQFKIGWRPLTSGTYAHKAGYALIVLGGTCEQSGTYTIEYDYEDLTNANLYTTRSSSAVASFGTIHKKIFLPQLTNAGGNNLVQFNDRYLARFGTMNRRFTIRVPELVNYARENYKVKIIDEDHGQTTELAIPIRSMKFYYPQGYTIIDCGEHYLDSYDLDNAFGTALHELRTNILKTQTQAA